MGGTMEDDTKAPEQQEAGEVRTQPRAETGQAPETETIEGLVFQPNPDYPYPFKVAKPPRFWMEEQTGVLEDAVETYMAGDKVSPQQLRVLKIYLKQFVERAPMTGEADTRRLLQRIERLKTTREIEDFAEEIAEFGAEVF